MSDHAISGRRAPWQGPQSLFIYGSLLTGTGSRRLDAFVRHHCRAGTPAFINARLYNLGAYPGATLSRKHGEHVFGQVCRLRSASRCLRILDRYELCDPHNPDRGEFTRRRIYASLVPSGKKRRCWVYCYNGSVMLRRRIGSGHYAQHLRGGV